MEKKGAGPFAKMAILQPMVSKMEGLLFLILHETIFVIEPGVAGWRMKPARRGSVRLGGAKAEARGRLPPFVSGSFFHFFFEQGMPKGRL